MDINWEQIALIVAAVLGTGGLGGTLGYRLQWRKQQTDALLSARRERREDFETFVEKLEGEMERLRQERDKADARGVQMGKDLAEFKGSSEARVAALSDKVDILEGVIERARLICPFARDNPGMCALNMRAPGSPKPAK